MSEKEIGELMVVGGKTNRTRFRNQEIKPLLEAGWLAMTIPDKPNSRLQKYRLTAKGQAHLAPIRPPQPIDTNLNAQE